MDINKVQHAGRNNLFKNKINGKINGYVYTSI